MAFVAVTSNNGATPVGTPQSRMLAASGPAAPRVPDAGSADGHGHVSTVVLAAAAGVAGALSSRRHGGRRGKRTVMKQEMGRFDREALEALDNDDLKEALTSPKRKITAKTDVGAKTFDSSPRESDEGIMELAKKVGLNLEVKPWDFLSNIAKDAARDWFVQRAEDRGIAWRESVAKLEAQQASLDKNFEQICDPEVEYPSYYNLPFHGYDTGNMSWNAAHELEAATQSMCLGYYDGMTWQDAQEKFRSAARREIAEYWRHGDCKVLERFSQRLSTDKAGLSHMEEPRTLLDIGCSGGFSTDEMMKTFPGVKATGLDLSPYYLSVAKHTYPHIDFIHGRAESTKLPDGSFDIVTLNFLLHELPREVSEEVLKEAYRLLAPGGIIAILDVDPRRLLELPAFRRWAFQVTEPWCKDGEYYSLNLPKALQDAGFRAVKHSANDPVNELVLATK